MPPQVGVGVAALVFKNDEVLMIHRQGSHGAGTVSFPGGWVEKNETLLQAAMREVHEEVGLHVTPVQEFGFTEDFHVEGVQDVCFFIWCKYQGGEPTIHEPEKVRDVFWYPDRAVKDLKNLFLPDAIYTDRGDLEAAWNAVQYGEGVVWEDSSQ